MATPKQLNGVRPGHTQVEKSAWAIFCLHMQGKQYSHAATFQAWGWFLDGWQSHIRGPRHAV